VEVAAWTAWLYGSQARGDADLQSDIDVLIVGEEPISWRDAPGVRRAVPGAFLSPEKVSPMKFTWDEIEKMADYGSLFLHHLRLEGIPLVDSSGTDLLKGVLNELPPYQRAVVELECFEAVLRDVEVSLEGDHSPTFELAVIGAALRHAFILGCYCVGRPTFSRVSPFTVLVQTLSLQSDLGEKAAALYQFRLHQQGRCAAPFAATSDDVRHWIEVASTLLAAIRKPVVEFDRTMSQPDLASSRSSV
jgi:hypothetical protein